LTSEEPSDSQSEDVGGWLRRCAAGERIAHDLDGAPAAEVVESASAARMNAGTRIGGRLDEDLIDADEAQHQSLLIKRARETENREQRQAALADGMLAYGPRFMHFLGAVAQLEQEEAWGGDRLQRLFDEALDLYTSWLGGKQLTDRVDEAERRYLVLAEAIDTNSALALSLARSILGLPEAHPLRDVDRARQLLEEHLERSRDEAWAHDEVSTIGLLLELEPVERSLELLEEGLAKSAELENQGIALEFQYSVAGYYAMRAIEARDGGDERAQLDWVSRALAQLDWVSGALAVHGPLSQAASQVALNVMLTVASVVLIGEPGSKEAVDLFRRIVDSPEASPRVASAAAMLEGRIRFHLGEYRRAADVLEAHVASFEEAYLTAVTDADIASTASNFENVVRNLAFARAHLDEWDRALQMLERGKSLRFRHRAAMRETASGRDLLALESVLYALARGVPVEGAAASKRAADVLGEAVSPQARMQEAYRKARPRVAPDVLRSPPVQEIAAALDQGEAAVLLGVHYRATMLAVVLPGDHRMPSGRWLLEDWPSGRWFDLLAGTEQDGWLWSLGAPEMGIDAGMALEGVIAGVDELLQEKLAPFLEVNAVQKVVVVPHLWLNSIPFWATPALAPYDVLMAPSAAQFVRARRRETPTIQGWALVVSNPTGDLPVSGAEAESVSLRLRRAGLQTSRLPNGGEATEDAIASALASGVSVFHFSGHGRSDLFQATRSALLLHPVVGEGEPESGRLDALVAPASEWHEEYEDFRWADVPGVGRLYERRWPESRLVERTLDYSERGTLWAQYDGEEIMRMAELWSAGDIMVGEVLSGCGLAVLSACESGSAQLSGTVDEYAGLPAAIGLAGAATVVSTLWPIDDALTALHVDLLYEALEKSTGEIDVSRTVRKVGERMRSLRRAEAVDLVEDLRQRTTDPIGRLFLERFRRDVEGGAEHPFERPYEWATFYVTGGGKIRVTHDDHA
jgi:hypothetical protein